MLKKILIAVGVLLILFVAYRLVKAEETVVPPVVVTETTEPVADEPTIIEATVDTEPIDLLPVLKQGFIYSVDDQSWDYAFTTPILEKNDFSLEGGYSVKDTIIAVASYRLGGLERLGINVPVLNLIDCNVGYYVGWKDFAEGDDMKFDHGVAATLLNIKF